MALSVYFIGAEARVRYGLLLAKTDRTVEAKAWLSDVLRQLSGSSLLAMAEKVVRG